MLDEWLAREGDHYAALTCGLAIPRQNGKNALLEMRELYGAVGLGEKILHTAHEVKTARKHFKRLQWFFGDHENDPHARFPALNDLVSQIRRVNGQEAVFLKNGGSIELSARSKNSARGFTVDVLVKDEAQELDDDALDALNSVVSAAPLGDPQKIMVGTPPGPNAAGDVFLRTRRNALLNEPPRTSWLEWSMEDGEVDLDDRAMWARWNPAMKSGRLLEAVVESDRSTMSVDGFLRERLGRFPSVADHGHLISNELWASTAVSSAPADGLKSFGVAFSLDGKRCCLAGAMKHPGGVHVELIDEPRSTGALADWLAGRWHDTAQIVISGAQGVALQQALFERGVTRKMVWMLSTSDYLRACGLFVDGLSAGGGYALECWAGSA